jgi:hypothetical protein
MSDQRTHPQQFFQEIIESLPKTHVIGELVFQRADISLPSFPGVTNVIVLYLKPFFGGYTVEQDIGSYDDDDKKWRFWNDFIHSRDDIHLCNVIYWSLPLDTHALDRMVMRKMEQIDIQLGTNYISRGQK